MHWQPDDAASQRKRSPSTLIAVLCVCVRHHLPGFEVLFAELGPLWKSRKITISHRCHSPDIMLQ